MPRLRRATGALVAALVVPVATLAIAVAPPATAAVTDIRINEIITTSDTVDDAIELTNVGSEPVDVSGWILKDDNDSRDQALPDGTSLAPGEFLAVTTDFGLGNGDAARVFLPDGTTLIDGHTFPSHSLPSWSRCPDGTGEFRQAKAETLGAANDCSTWVVLNEVESSGDTTDWVELVNTGTAAEDLSGWVIKDDDDTHTYVVPDGTELGAGAYLQLADLGFGLGGSDQARVYAADGTTQVDSYAWTSHAATTYGRCPDGVGDFASTATATPGETNDCPVPAGADDVRINEVESNGDPVGDWVELINVGDTAVDVSGWGILDDNAGHSPVTFPAGSTIEPGGFLAIYPADLPGGFGLGGGDTATLLLPDLVTVVDSYTWPDGHAATTYGRCPDGTGDFVETVAPTQEAPNACEPVRINEVESSGGDPGDWVEIVNAGGEPVDVSGWVVTDDDPSHTYPIPDGTTLDAGGHLVLPEADLGFGLGSGDAARLHRADGTTLVDTYAWTSHAETTYGRCPDGTGAFATTDEPTPGEANRCPGEIHAEAWPGGAEVTPADGVDVFGEDLSGLAHEPSGTAEPGVLWASQNSGALWRLLPDGRGGWAPDTRDGWGPGKALTFPGGTGVADAEGVTLTDAGASAGLFVASERDNDASGTSRLSVIRYDVSGSTADAATEWDLTGDLPAVGSNAGLEGIAWVPDAYLTEAGFVSDDGSAYDPTAYDAHAGGVFFVGVEGGGAVHGYVLEDDGDFTRLASLDSGLTGVMGLEWQAGAERLWVVCDDGCDGRAGVFAVDGSGAMAPVGYHERPAGMPNHNNEGFAIAAPAECADGALPVWWANDAADEGHSLRAGTLDCTEQEPPVTQPGRLEVVKKSEIKGKPRVGKKLRVTQGKVQPKPGVVRYRWLKYGKPIKGADGRKLKVRKKYRGTKIRVRVTYKRPGFEKRVVKTGAVRIRR